MITINKPMPEACDVCDFNYDFCYCRAMDDNAWGKYEDDWNLYVCERKTRPEYCPLKDQTPVDIEIEGGGSTWWYVCEECHGSVDRNDLFCRHCGRPFKTFRKKKCDGCSDDCPKVGNFVCPNGKL